MQVNREEERAAMIVEEERTRVIRLKDVIERTSLSRSTIYSKINPNSRQYDPDFPKQIKLGGGAVGWYEKDLEHWLRTRLTVTNSQE